jgi:two-component system chemotaxis response regulator CheB
MKPTRVLIVDDSSTVRMILRRYLAADPNIEIAGAAANGRQALDRLDDYRPDVVLLDVEMPELNGLETLAELRQQHPRLPVIMFSRFTQRGATATIEALFLGADDYVPKPDSKDALTKCVEEELLPRIHELAQRGGWDATTSNPRSGERSYRRQTVDTSKSASAVPDKRLSRSEPVSEPAEHEQSPATAPTPSVVQRRALSSEAVEVVVIAASTGGPPVLAGLLDAIGSQIRVPVLIVQHMPANFTAAFAERLGQKSQLNVREAKEDQGIDAAQVWVAPGDFHMAVCAGRGSTKARVQLNQNMPENACRPAANVLFRSAAEVFGPAVLGVVLTGMGNDALAGSRAIVEAGGQIVVQDEASSVVWGMPGHVAKAGLAEAILAPNELAKEISLRLMKRR